MQSLVRWFSTIAILLSAASSLAAPSIFFEPPKITDLKANGEAIVMPDNFAVYPFMGGPLNDAAVPDAVREILGMDNLDHWTSGTPNTYFTTNAVHHVGNHILQVIEGDFNESGASDLLSVNTGAFNVCYDFTGTACAASSDSYNPAVVDAAGASHTIVPFAGAIADFNGDGKDDAAIIGYTYDTFQGYLTVYLGNGAGGPNPLTAPAYYQSEIPQGIPLSIAVGDYNHDGKSDIALGSMPGLQNPGGAFGSSFINGGVGFTQTDHVFDFTAAECHAPTGLLSYDADGDLSDDLVLTCYQGLVCGPAAVACIPTPVSGPVVTFKNTAAGTAFAKQQTIQNLNFPYSSSLGDFNADGMTDLAVASNGGQAVIVHAGTGPFLVTDPGKNFSTAPYPPKFIQTQMMNGDTSPDLILTANEPHLPGLRRIDNLAYDAYLDRIDLVQSKLLVSRSSGLSGKVLVGDKVNLAKANINRADLLETKFERVDPTHLKYQYAPNRVAREFSRAHYFQEKDLNQASLDYFDKIGSIEEIPGTFIVVPTHGVLVLLHNRPEVSIDEPACDVNTVTYHCIATGANLVVDCTVTTAEAGVTIAPATPAGPAAEKTGTMTLPNQEKSYTFTVTAVDSGNNPVSGDFTVDFTHCPQTNLNECPAAKIEKYLIENKPYMICPFESDPTLAAALAGKTVTWNQVSGDDLFTVKGSVIEAATIQDGCITGRVGSHLGLGQSVYEFKYSVQDGPKDCPATLVIPNLILEGSGCQLGPSTTEIGQTWFWCLWLAVPLLRVFRRK